MWLIYALGGGWGHLTRAVALASIAQRERPVRILTNSPYASIVAAAVLAVGSIAGLVGWGKRVKQPLESTRRSLKEDALWAQERLA